MSHTQTHPDYSLTSVSLWLSHTGTHTHTHTHTHVVDLQIVQDGRQWTACWLLSSCQLTAETGQISVSAPLHTHTVTHNGTNTQS